MKPFHVSVSLLVALTVAVAAYGQSAPPTEGRVDKNVVYGMCIIYVGGNAWHAPLSYDATPLKDSPALQAATKPLVEAGYTVFVINHRTACRFRYPAPLAAERQGCYADATAVEDGRDHVIRT